MPSSREARSARRDALRSKLAASRAGKVSKKNPSARRTKSPAHEPKSQIKSVIVKQIETALEKENGDNTKLDEVKAEDSIMDNLEEIKQEEIKPEEIKPEEIKHEEIKPEEVKPLEKATEPKDTTPQLETQLSATDDEFDAYVQEFEEASLGDCIPAPTEFEIPSIPPQRTPPPPLTDSSPLGSPCISSSPHTPIEEYESSSFDAGSSIDEYITYDQDGDNTPSLPPTENTYKYKRSLMSLCKFQPSQQTFHNSFNPNKRTLMAAWYTMAQDILNGPREAYIHSVLLAAASLNQRSMLSGGARQTMSPGI